MKTAIKENVSVPVDDRPSGIIAKYRAWDKRNNRWETSGVFFNNSTGELQCIPDLIVTEAIGTDKNGKDLFCGDIVKVKGTKKVGEYLTVIIKKGCNYQLQENKTYIKDGVLISSMFEVVGNIFQNPNMIEKAK